MEWANLSSEVVTGSVERFLDIATALRKLFLSTSKVLIKPKFHGLVTGVIS